MCKRRSDSQGMFQVFSEVFRVYQGTPGRFEEVRTAGNFCRDQRGSGMFFKASWYFHAFSWSGQHSDFAVWPAFPWMKARGARGQVEVEFRKRHPAERHSIWYLLDSIWHQKVSYRHYMLSSAKKVSY